MSAAQTTADAGRTAFEPINSLVAKLSISGNDLVQLSGYMTALWHDRDLDSYRMPSRIEDARAAIKKASAALDAYEASVAVAKGSRPAPVDTKTALENGDSR